MRRWGPRARPGEGSYAKVHGSYAKMGVVAAWSAPYMRGAAGDDAGPNRGTKMAAFTYSEKTGLLLIGVQLDGAAAIKTTEAGGEYVFPLTPHKVNAADGRTYNIRVVATRQPAAKVEGAAPKGKVTRKIAAELVTREKDDTKALMAALRKVLGM